MSDDDRGVHSVLNRYDFYKGAAPDIQQAMCDAASYVQVGRGDSVMRTGELCDCVLFVGNGRVRVYVEAESGRVANLYHVHAGECCPINIGSCLMREEACANAAAVGAVDAAVIPTDRFDVLRDENAHLRDWLFDATAVRYSEIVSLLRDVITLTVDQRLADYMLSHAEETGEGDPIVNITHASIAMEIGTAREVVNRRLKALQAADVVKLGRGSISISDAAALKLIRNGDS